MPKQTPDHKIARIRQLWQNGLFLGEIADRVGCGVTTVQKYTKGIQPGAKPIGRPRTFSHRRAGDLRACGFTHDLIAERLGVSASGVRFALYSAKHARSAGASIQPD